MKKFVLLSAIVAALAFAMGNASANVLSITGTAVLQKTNYLSSKSVITGTTANLAFSSKTLYSMVSNTVNSALLETYNFVNSTTVPANGYIAFDPNFVTLSTNGDAVKGLFYVTNSSGFYYPLSGIDDNGHYYSWMELDTQSTLNTFTNVTTTTVVLDNIVFTTTNIVASNTQFGWLNTNIVGQLSVPNGPFNGVSTYNYNSVTGVGTATETSTALFYFHDNPYTYDGADDPDIFWGNTQDTLDDAINHNSNAVEIRGIATTTIKFKGASVISETISLTGSGNFAYQGNYGYVIKTATATLK
jgi:hypothetical protein